MMMQSSAQTSWLEKMQEKVTAVFNSFDFSLNSLIKLSLYFAVAFFVGFILKKFGKLLFFLLISCVLLFVVLHYLGIATFNGAQLQAYLHIQPTETLDQIIQGYYLWIKNNLVVSISVALGCIVGYKFS